MAAPRINIHASCVALARAGNAFGAPRDAGVLILGESGTGKSDLALRLIAMGATLVADDRCDLFVTSGALRAAVPATLAGMIEVRGVGIVRVPHQPDAQILLVVRLEEAEAIPRLPEPAKYRPPPPLDLPEEHLPQEILLAPFEAASAAKVLAAAAVFARRRRR
ncbi:MAG TPA: hypothetical protein VHY79_01515 [Rhizomicrobium sp.]|jgi:serine kinase of HPr protein (carbohydrate metabolism regulator)|nr:hypothetical protein [Rhizomicrobium sp.]